MGRAASLKPKLLAEKLRQIRLSLALSQNEIIRHMDLEDRVAQADISAFELGARVPPLNVLLAYARAVGISTDVLIDDELDLPAKLPLRTKRR